MTKEEAITKYIIPAIEKTWNDKKCKEILEALKQGSCDDAINRKTVKIEYKRQLESKLQDNDRGIDLSEFVDCTAFNKFIDDCPNCTCCMNERRKILL